MKPIGAALVAALWLLPAPAQTGDADIVFWNSVRDSGDPAAYQAYLHAFPQGRFAPLARIRAGTGQGTPEAPAPAPQRSAARVTVSPSSVRAVDRLSVEFDARSLRDASNLYLLVVPGGTPEALDAETIAAVGRPIRPELFRTTLPPAPSGPNEVRIYDLPRFETSFRLEASAPVDVAPPASGAVVVDALVREARALGTVGFEARYRDREIRVTGQFLRLETGTAAANWLDLLRGVAPPSESYVILHVGHVGTPSDEGTPSEVACVVGTDEAAVLQTVSELAPGDEVVFVGRSGRWGVGGSATIPFDPCILAR